ncbi:MAG: PIG-L family deacetylase [Planctomycetes bacterium]|nr:PIG-L family deacetylase [Planctomycetota bacterium]
MAAGLGTKFAGPAAWAAAAPAGVGDGKLRVIAFGAHPDDCEIRVGGVGAMWAAQGHHVKLVSLTNGDIGHWREAGGPLAQRRTREVQESARILGTTVEVCDIHDGELMPTLENRRLVTRLIREWKADVVLGPRTNDYHPDHRYAGILVQDAAFMVTVPFFCPDVPALKRNPVFLYYGDRFQRPNPFRPDVVVGIDSVMEQKLKALVAIQSQFVEGGCGGHEGLVPTDDASRKAREDAVRASFRQRFAATANQYRAELIEIYGQDAGKQVKCAEVFELCEYGAQPALAELRKLFPIVRP